jgi:sugar lactone lactonase YvrE
MRIRSTPASSTPESVLYDEARDLYIVGNINGGGNKADDNGFLVVVNPDGSNASFRWIDGSAPDIKLDAPKGMAIVGDTLYVADLTVVRRFEAKSGKQLDDIKIAGAVFLNDITPDGNGGVYVSDNGEGAEAVHHIGKDGKVTTLIKNAKLGRPNGLWSAGNGSVWVVTYGSGEIYEVDAKGKQGPAQKLPTGALDGLVVLDNGDFAVSSWEGKCVYRGKPGGAWTAIVKDVEAPADITYDPKRKRIVIPSFTTSKLIVHQL